jgi:hypothetical protein
MRFGFNAPIFKSYRGDGAPFRIPESKSGRAGRHFAMTPTGLIMRQARRRPSSRNLGKR